MRLVCVKYLALTLLIWDDLHPRHGVGPHSGAFTQVSPQQEQRQALVHTSQITTPRSSFQDAPNRGV